MPTDTSNPEVIRAGHTKAGRKIEYIGIVWTSLEALIGITIGVLAQSVSLTGFGVDSGIEVASGVVLLWRLSDHPDAEKREERAQKLVGVCFLALAAYILFDALHDLITRTPPLVSYLGIGYAIACIIVMPLIARAKRRVAASLDSAALQADSRQSDICAYLAFFLLVGLVLNALLGWWWADPVAALCMTTIIIKEGVGNVRGKSCCHCQDNGK